jgi:hypothetical protein
MKYAWNWMRLGKMQDETVDAEFEAMVTRGLEHGAEVAVPVDFAARVRAALPAVAPRRSKARVGRVALVVAAFVLAVAMFALAPHAAPTFGNLAFDLELVVIVQLAGVGYWLTAKKGV